MFWEYGADIFDNLVAEWQEMHESWNESGDVFFFFG